MNLPDVGDFKFSVVAFTISEDNVVTVNYTVSNKETEFFMSDVITFVCGYRHIDDFMRSLKEDIVWKLHVQWTREKVIETLKDWSFTETIDFRTEPVRGYTQTGEITKDDE